MKKSRLGFTILETTLFLAISGLLLVAITAGMTRRVSHERYENAVKDLANFLKDTYANTLNTENARYQDEGSRSYCTISALKDSAVNAGISVESGASLGTYPGRTKCSIYGKLIVFGDQSYTNDTKVYVFDIVGDVVDHTSLTTVPGLVSATTTLEALQAVHADYLAFVPKTSTPATCQLTQAGGYLSYEPDWGTKIVTTDSSSKAPFAGMVMIVRSPISGAVSTYVNTIDTNSNYKPTKIFDYVNHYAAENTCTSGLNISDSELKSISIDFSNFTDEKDKDANMCLVTDDFWSTGFRRYVGILAGGQNASAVLTNETEGNPCAS